MKEQNIILFIQTLRTMLRTNSILPRLLIVCFFFYSGVSSLFGAKTIKPNEENNPCLNRLVLRKKVINEKAINCEGLNKVCLPTAKSFNGNIWVDGNLINTSPCDIEDVTIYKIQDLLGTNDNGPWEVIWKVGKGALRGRIENRDSLFGFIRKHDIQKEWKINTKEMELIGPLDNKYKTFSTVSADLGKQYKAEPEFESRGVGVSIELSPGTYEIIAQNKDGCSDTSMLNLQCRTVIKRSVSAIQGVEGKHCLPVNGKSSEYDFIITEDRSAPYIDVQGIEEGCVKFKAIMPGTSRLKLEACNLKTNDCDVIQVDIEVYARESVKPPRAVSDLFGIAFNGQRMVDIAFNDKVVGNITSLKIVSEETKGSTKIDALNRLHYTAATEWCGNDKIEYEICNEGGCDRATVNFQVTCDKIIVFNGFSPNGDGKNDFFTILGVENFKENQLMVFDKLGQEIINQKNYQNKWDGTYKGAPVKDGTYYYVFEAKGLDSKSGYIHIKR